MFFLVYFDKTDYKLIVFLPSKVKIHETSSGTQISLAMYTGSFQRYRGKRYFKFCLSFISLLMLFLRNSLSISLVCCFDVDLRQSTSELSEGNLEEERWHKDHWSHQGPSPSAPKSGRRWHQGEVYEVYMKWTTWQPSTVTCSRPGSFSKETWFWRFYDQIHIVLIFLIGW